MNQRGWLLPLSSVFAVSAAATLVALSAGPGCNARCQNDFDCGPGSHCVEGLSRCETQCFTNEDCLRPPECAGDPLLCRPLGLRCTVNGQCVGPVARIRTDRRRDVVLPNNGGPIEGWDSPPGTGKAFIVNAIQIAGEGRGFDIDQSCDNGTGACIDNILWQLGSLGNDQIRQGLLGGESLLLVELAGLDESYRGDDESVAVKIYGARDADDPFFPANNFKVPPGHTSCCEFKINPQSIAGPPPQARARAPAKIERGRLFSLTPVPIQFTLTVGVPPHPEIRLERVLVSGRIPASKGEFNEGLLGGAVPINTLAQTENPYCKTVSPRCTVQFTDSTLIDLVSQLLTPRPDIDLDLPGDGLECVIDTDGDGRVDRCCDGNRGGRCDTDDGRCAASEVPPVDPMHPWTCALSPRMADGYSVGIQFTAVQATIVGVGQ